METLLVFLAIAVIQIIASYSKHKKEAAKKAAKKSAPPPPEATRPIPDPFREIREAMGFPSAEEQEEFEEPEKPKAPEKPKEPEHFFKEEGVAPAKNIPFRSIADRKHVAHEEHGKNEQEILPKSRELKIDTSKPSQGILWTAILQEPRYKKKWKPITSNRQ